MAMSALKTGLCSVAILAAGTAAFAGITHGFKTFTTEGALRLSVQEAPRTVPAVRLQGADGQWLALSGQAAASAGAAPWRVAGFMYTRCMTVCSVQGAEFVQLQTLLAPEIAQGQVALLSVSFDPQHDTPAALGRWQARFGGSTDGWRVTRPAQEADLRALLDTFGVKTIPDGLGGFEHNAAFNLINPQGQLVAVMDWSDPEAAAQEVRGALQR